MAKVAFVLAQDYEDSEFRKPYDEVRRHGHEVVVVGSRAGEELRGKQGKDRVEVDTGPAGVRADEFDALVIPGGYSPDKLRLDREVVAFVKDMVESGKPVAAICHAAQLLVEADVLRGRTVTSWPSVRKDAENAGARWVDRELVEDENLISSRKPEDLDAFCGALLARLS